MAASLLISLLGLAQGPVPLTIDQVFSALFGMAGVWGNQAGLSVREVSIFIGAMYVGGLIAQFPIGWLSDRMDRRLLILQLLLLGVAVVDASPDWLNAVYFYFFLF